MPRQPRPSTPAGRLIDYARVSTEEQDTDPQLIELHAAAGCEPIHEEHASGPDRPMLARLTRDPPR